MIFCARSYVYICDTTVYRDNVAISFVYRTISRQILLEGSNFKDVHYVKVFYIYYIFTHYFLFIIYLNFIFTCNCHCILLLH